MSKEKKTVELKDEDLEKVGGGNVLPAGNCGIPTMICACTQYNCAQDQCNSCLGKPLTVEGLSTKEEFLSEGWKSVY